MKWIACAAPAAWLALVVPTSEARAAAASAPAMDRVSVEPLARARRVIPLVTSYDKLWVTDANLPELVVTNASRTPMSIGAIAVVGKAAGSVKVTYDVDAASVAAFLEKASPKLAAALNDPGMASPLKMAFGDFMAPGPLAATPLLQPGQKVVLQLSRWVHLSYVGDQRIDAIDVVVGYTQDGQTREARLAIALPLVDTKGKYRFPLRPDGLLAGNLPTNLTQHRRMRSQEFGFDVLAVKFDRKGALDSKPATATGAADYYIFGRDVLAAADGVIVVVATGYPDAKAVDPRHYSEESFAKASAELQPKIGFANAMAGNFVVIDHGGGEFGFYAHLAEKSIARKVGDRVKQGEVIARVGTTGHSTEPHLHFQLMDSADMITANGLPVTFTDLRPQDINQNYTSANALVGADFVLLPPALAQ